MIEARTRAFTFADLVAVDPRQTFLERAEHPEVGRRIAIAHLAAVHEHALDLQILIDFGPVQRRELIKILNQLLFPLLVEDSSGSGAAECRWTQSTESLDLAPCERDEVESLQVVEVLDASIQSTIDNHPVANQGTAVIPTTRIHAIEVFDLHIVPLLGRQVKHEDVAIHGAHIPRCSAGRATLAAIDDQVVLVGK